MASVVNQETQGYRLPKKPQGPKSRETLPLSQQSTDQRVILGARSFATCRPFVAIDLLTQSSKKFN
jgi:hypothetical protein